MTFFIAKRTFKADPGHWNTTVSDPAIVLRGSVFLAESVSDLPYPWKSADQEMFKENPEQFFYTTKSADSKILSNVSHKQVMGNCS